MQLPSAESPQTTNGKKKKKKKKTPKRRVADLTCHFAFVPLSPTYQ